MRARRLAWVLAVLPILVAAGAASAQTASQDRSNLPASMAITVGDKPVPSLYRIEPITASSNVQRYDVVCAPRQETAGRPGVVCDIRFDQPTALAGHTVGETPAPASCGAPTDCWTSSLVPIAASGAGIADDSAFLFMLDRGGRDAGTVHREDRDLVAILANAGAEQQIAVATFSRSLKIRSGFGADRASMSNELASFQPDHSVTELYKSAIDGIRLLADRKARRKFLVILSDGTAKDTAYDETGLINAARNANVQIIALGYAPDPGDTSKLQKLGKIANDTNGAYFEIRGSSQLSRENRKSFMSRFSSGYFLTAEAPSSQLPSRVYVSLRFDQGGTSLIPIDTGTSSPNVGTGGTPAPPVIVTQPSLLDRIKSNVILVIGAAAALIIAAIAALLFLRSRRASRHETPAPAPAADMHDHYTPPPPPPQSISPLPLPPEPFIERNSHLEPERDCDGGATVLQNKPSDLGPTYVAPPVGGGEAKPLAFVEIEEQGRQRRVPISKNLARIGRSPDNDIMLPADHVSRDHAEIISNGFGGWDIKNRTWRRPATDGGINPIEVNGKQVDGETHPLHDGDVIRLGNIGNTHLTFRHNAQRSR